MGLIQIEPPQELYNKILLGIEQKQKQEAKLKLAFSGFFTLASLLALVPAVQYALQGFSQSGFYNYFSLLFSDGLTLLTYWKEFSLSLAESFPLTEMVVFLSIMFILLISLKLFIKNTKVAFLSAQFS